MPKIQEHRQGQPSPLIFHLGAAAFGYQAAVTSASKKNPAFFELHPELLDQAAGIGDLNPLLLHRAALNRIQATLSGLHKWQTHPYRRDMADPPELWSSGSSRLLDFGICPEAVNPNGRPILIVPSLINRAYILDLKQNCSLLRFLATNGLRPLLLDWGVPTDVERSFDLNSYVTQRLQPAFHIARALSEQQIGVLGYCMGGTLAAGFLSLKNGEVGAFATLGSPWDFSASSGVTAVMRALATKSKAADLIDELGQVFGMVPADYFQQLFALIDPLQVAVKFRKLDEMATDASSIEHFIAIEDWLADGVPMATQSAKNLLIDWNLYNATARGVWRLMNQQINLSGLRMPSLHVCGLRDSISQINASIAMANEIPNSMTLTPDTGHVGMIVGSKARETVWEPVAKHFIRNL